MITQRIPLGIVLVLAIGPWAAALRAETLDEAWGRALAVSDRLGASREKVASAEWSRTAAGGARLPAVMNATGYNFLSDTPTANIAIPNLPPLGLPLVEKEFLASTTMAVMPLYTGGRIMNMIDAADCQVNAAVQEQHRTALDVKLDMATAYTLVLYARRGTEVADMNVTSLQSHAHDVKQMLDQELVARNTLLAAQVSLANARQKAFQAANNLDAAKATYNRLLCRALDSPVELDELQVPPLSGDLQPLTEMAMNLRPELAELAAQASALQSKAASVRAENLPQLGVGGGYTYLENRSLDPEGIWSLTFGMEWKPLDGGITRAKGKALEHDASAVARLRADTASAIALQVRKTWLDEQESRRRVDVAKQAIQQAEENLRVTRDRFKHGAGTNTEVLDAETLRTQAYTNFYGALYDAVLATFRLRRAVGNL
jgi:outer membrane protein TolC